MDGSNEFQPRHVLCQATGPGVFATSGTEDACCSEMQKSHPLHSSYTVQHYPSSLSDLTANPLILLKWHYFLEAKLLSLFKGLKISMMPSPTGC
jgi:hypothetical protein